MKKFTHKKNLFPHSETLNFSRLEKLESELAKLSVKKNSNLIKAGIFAIKNDVKRSILSVPKKPVCYALNLKENKLPYSFTPDTETVNCPKLASFTPKLINPLNLDASSSQTCKSARKSILSSTRYRKNPNIETLKVALEEISKNPLKPNGQHQGEEEEGGKKIKETLEKITSSEKSDIEKLIESQKTSGSVPLRKKHPKIRVQTTLHTEKSDDSVSQKSDPSPVREKLPVLKPDRRGDSQKFLMKTNTKKYKNGFCEVLRKIKLMNKMPLMEPSKNFFNSMNSENPDNSWKFDYELESLRILKDTSSFANKIMKTIRTGARSRNC